MAEQSNNLSGLRAALGFSVSAIAAEHFFSAGMSSPWSVAKFATTPTDQAQVWRLFWENILAGIAFAAVTGILLHDFHAFLWSVVGAAGVGVFVWSEYDRALKGTL